MFKKLLLSLLISLTVFASFAPALRPVFADDSSNSWYNQSFPDWYSKVYDTTNPSEIFGERYTAAQVQWIFYSILSLPLTTNPKLFTCIFSGNAQACLQTIVDTVHASAQNQSNVASQKQNPNLVQLIFADRPLSGITYTKDIFRKFHIIPEAQAQTTGFGFGALNPVLDLWVGSRNIAYILLILATIVMSFMIMFRVKISPQLVISVQSALPKIFLALILITFSYAIAGFLIDLMYVAIGLVSLLFTSYVHPLGGAGTIFNFLTNGQPFGVATPIGVLGLVFVYVLTFQVAIVVIFFTGAGMLGIIATGIAAVAVAPLLGAAAPWLFLLALILIFIIAVLLFIHVIKILWMLFKAFSNILLLTIFAPLQILAGVLIPNLGFTAWLKSYVANLAVFVVTGVLFLLSWLFLWYAMGFAFKATIANPDPILAALNTISGGVVSSILLSPGVTNSWPPLLGGGGNMPTAFIMLGASLVLFTLIPKTAEVIQGFISGRPFAYGSAVGESLAFLTGTAGFVLGGAQKGAQEFIGSQTAGRAKSTWERFRTGRGTPPPPTTPPGTPGGGGVTTP